MTSNDIEMIKRMEYAMREQEPNVYNKFVEEDFDRNFNSRKIENTDNYETVICIEDGEVIGRIDLMFEQSFMDFKKVGYVDWVNVLKSHRKKGIAKLLFKEGIKYFKSNECVLYYLFVAKNEEAQAFYKSIDINIEMIERGSKIFK
jgi:GNAT superfamily N-acetyltransferase